MVDRYCTQEPGLSHPLPVITVHLHLTPAGGEKNKTTIAILLTWACEAIAQNAH